MLPTFKSTITLYNRYTVLENGRNVTKWKRTVIKGCYFGVQKRNILSGETLSKSDEYICRIPQNPSFTEAFSGQPDKFTLNKGDIILSGEISERPEDTEGKRVSDFLKKYRGFTVTGVSINTLLPFPHYRASGE